jgi:hypothetical protein
LLLQDIRMRVRRLELDANSTRTPTLAGTQGAPGAPPPTGTPR